jgi:hypothetical protein
MLRAPGDRHPLIPGTIDAVLPVMNTSEPDSDRWGALSGLIALLLGATGGALERGWPSASHPIDVAEFIATNRSAILAQSMLFLLSAVFNLWFLAATQASLLRASRRAGTLATLVFGAGCVWAAISMVAQAFQIGVTLAPTGAIPSSVLWTMAATFGIANLPLAVTLVAVALASIRYAAFPRWLGYIALLAAASQILLWFGTVVQRGPLAPNGWLTYALYPMFAVWLVPTTVIMFKRRDPSRERSLVPGEPTVREQGSAQRLAPQS